MSKLNNLNETDEFKKITRENFEDKNIEQSRHIFPGIKSISTYKEMFISKQIIGMDSNTSDVISKLKFIGKIQKGEKINVRFLYVQPHNWLTSITRTLFNNDNRKNAFNFIENIVNRSFEIINYNKLSIYPIHREIVKNIVADLKQAIIGILNLKSTYEFDTMYCCQLDTLVESVSSRISEFTCENELSEKLNELDV